MTDTAEEKIVVKAKHNKKRKAGRVILWVLLAALLFGAAFSFFPFKMNDPEKESYNRRLFTVKCLYRGLYGTVRTGEGNLYMDGAVPVLFAQGLTIRGNGTTVVNTGYGEETADADTGFREQLRTGFFVLFGCRNVTVSDIAIDCLSASNIVGTISEVGYGCLTVRVQESVLKQQDGAVPYRPVTGKEKILAVNEYRDGVIVSDEYLNGAKLEIDAENAEITVNGVSASHSVAGDLLVIRFAMDQTIPPFVIYGSKNTVIENVRVKASANMLVAGSFNDGLTIRGMHVESERKEEMRWAAASDCIHLSNMTGTITVEDCTFIGLGDDAFNYNSLAMAGKVSEEDGRLSIQISDPSSGEPVSRMLVKKGDVLRLYTAAAEPLGEVKVEAVRKGVATVEASASVADFAVLPEKGFFVQNTRFLPEIVIRNNTVADGRARAFLLRSENVSVTDNEVSNLALAGILVTYDLNYWHEMGPARNVCIENNTFVNCCTENSGSNFGVIAIKGGDDAAGAAIAYPVVRDVTVRNNTFTDCGAPAVYATGMRGLVYEENTVSGQKNPKGMPQWDKELLIGKCVE